MQQIVELVKKGFSTFALQPQRLMQMVVSAITLLALISLEITTTLVGTTPVLAAPIFTPSDQDQAITSFISAFYDPTNHFFYTDTQNHAEADLWTEAVDWGIVMDAYSRTKNNTYNQMIGDIYNHVTSVYGANCGQWQVPNASNETLVWWARASLQAYTVTNNTTYRDCAKGFFDKIYQSWDTTQAGGGIWTLNNQTTQKNMATNALAAMTAAQLSTILGNSTYMSDAQGIYNWIRSHLTGLTSASGAVYDRYDNTNNTIIMNQFSYNYGLFIGAALALNDATKGKSSATNNQSVNYLSDANNVANASLTNVTIDGDGIIQYESDCNNNTAAGDTSNSISGNNGDIVNDGSFVNESNTCAGGTNERALYKGVYAHYLADLAFNSNYAVSQSAAYGQVLDENAALAWNDRLPSSNLVGADWAEPAPTGPIKSWEAASAVEILQVLPNNNNIATYQSQDATLQGGLSLATQSPGYFSNSGYIGNWIQNGQSISYTASAAAAGTELLIIRYAAGTGNAVRYLQINGNQNTANIPTGPIYSSGTSNSVITQISFPGTNSWSAYDLAVIPVLLTQGNNTITISFSSSQNSQNALNVDELTVTPGFPSPFATNSANLASPATTTTTSTTTVSNPAPVPIFPGNNPENFEYNPGRCVHGFPIPNKTLPEGIHNSFVSGRNDGKGGHTENDGKYRNSFIVGSNTGKIGNIPENIRNNAGKCGNESSILSQPHPSQPHPGQPHPFPNGPHPFRGNVSHHTPATAPISVPPHTFRRGYTPRPVPTPTPTPVPPHPFRKNYTPRPVPTPVPTPIPSHTFKRNYTPRPTPTPAPPHTFRRNYKPQPVPAPTPTPAPTPPHTFRKDVPHHTS